MPLIRSVRIILLLPFFLLSCGGDHRDAGSGPVELRLRLKPGESYQLWSESEQKIDHPVFGQGLTQYFGIGTTYRVLGVDTAGVATVSMMFDSVAFHQDGGGVTADYNSGAPAGEIAPMARGFAALHGESFTAMVGADGRVLNIDGIDSLWARMQQKLKQSTSAEEMVGRSALRRIDSGWLRNMVEGNFAYLPAKAVAVGDTWPGRLSGGQGIVPEMASRYELESVDGTNATIALKSSIDRNNPATGKMGGFNYSIAGGQDGAITVDLATGLPAEGEVEQKYSGNLQVQGGSGREYPVKVEGVTRVRRR